MFKKEEIEYLLNSTDTKEINELFEKANIIRQKHMGEGILLRGLIEFSNYCSKPCSYCGLNLNNKEIQRYRLTKKEIMECIDVIAFYKIKTVVLQSGEDDYFDVEILAEIIKEIKSTRNIAITLSVGERNYDEYKLWKSAGADRYLLKIETTNRQLYESFHPGLSFDNRINCINNLVELGYQTGSGIMIGLPGQTIKDIAEDILYLTENEFDMVGIGPFIAHPLTPLANYSNGNAQITLKAIALTRILLKNAHIPATTSLGSLESDFRVDGLRAGANVLMPNFTPSKYKKLYEIYPNKRCIEESQGKCVDCMNNVAKSINRKIDLNIGHSIKKKGFHYA